MGIGEGIIQFGSGHHTQKYQDTLTILSHLSQMISYFAF